MAHGEGEEEVDRWKRLERLGNGSATALGDLLQQELCYGTAAGAELEELEGRADLWGNGLAKLAPSLAAFHHRLNFPPPVTSE